MRPTVAMLIVGQVHADVCEAIVAAAFLPQGGSFERSIEVMEYLGLGFKHLEAIRRIAARSMSLWGDKPPTIPVWSSLLVPPLFDDRILANALALYRVLIPWSRLERASHPRHAESPPVAVAEWKLGQSALRLCEPTHPSSSVPESVTFDRSLTEQSSSVISFSTLGP